MLLTCFVPYGIPLRCPSKLAVKNVQPGVFVLYLRKNLALPNHKRVQPSADPQQVQHGIIPREHEKVAPQLRLREARVLLQVGHHVSDSRVAVVGADVHLETVTRGKDHCFLNVRVLAQLFNFLWRKRKGGGGGGQAKQGGKYILVCTSL